MIKSRFQRTEEYIKINKYKSEKPETRDMNEGYEQKLNTVRNIR
jgi:hypothetical protein